MKVIKYFLILIMTLSLLTSCNPADHTLITNTKDNSSTSSIILPAEEAENDSKKIVNLSIDFPDIVHICPYDSSNILVLQKNQVSLYNLEEMDKGRDIPIDYKTAIINKLHSNLFNGYVNGKLVILDKELNIINNIDYPNSVLNNNLKISSNGNSIIFVDNNDQLMYLPNESDTPIKLAESSQFISFINDSKVVTSSYNKNGLSYSIIDVLTMQSKEFNTSAVQPAGVAGGKLLLSESMAEDFTRNNIVRVMTIDSTNESFIDIKMEEEGESCDPILSDNGKYVISLYPRDQNSMEVKAYSTDTGNKVWSKNVSINFDYNCIQWPMYFESTQTLAFTIIEDPDTFILRDACVIHL